MSGPFLLAPRAKVASGVRRTFRSLRVRNYRLWFFGQTISQSGTWMQAAMPLACSWALAVN